MSPPLQLTSKNIQGVSKKKTIAFTSFNVPEFSIDHLTKIYDKHLKLKNARQGTVDRRKKDLGDKLIGPFDERNIIKYG